LLAQACRTLLSAKRPLVVAGGGIHLSGAADALARLQQEWQIPVATTNMGKGAVDESHPLSMGVIGYAMGSRSPSRFLRDYVESADCVLFIGNRTNENGTASWTLFDKDAAFIHIDVDPDELGRNYPCLRLLGDARDTLTALLEEGPALGFNNAHPEAGKIRETIAAARAAHARELAPFLVRDRVPMRPECLLKELDACVGDVTWVADASYSSLWLAQFVGVRRAGQRFVTPRGIGGLGWGLPLAIGAKLAEPGRTVIAVVGDGGFAHCWAELETARRHGLPVIVVVLNNGMLGFQRDAEISRFGSHTSVCEFGPIDHVAIARACGCDGRHLRTPDEIREVVYDALRSAVPFVIDAHVSQDAFPPITAFEQLATGQADGAPDLLVH
jgi:acetolactate synthase-1/2/3 large subunit